MSLIFNTKDRLQKFIGVAFQMDAHLTDSFTISRQFFELGREAEVLRHVPFDKVTVEDQIEVGTAYPKTILYGKTNGKAAKVWIYWSKGLNKLRFHSFFDDNSPDGWLTAEEVVENATPSKAFHYVTTANDLCVLATYYFFRAGVGLRKSLQLLPYQLSALLTMAKKFEVQTSTAQKSMIVVLPVRFLPDVQSAAAAQPPDAPGVTGKSNSGIAQRTLQLLATDSRTDEAFQSAQVSIPGTTKSIKHTYTAGPVHGSGHARD